MADFHKASSWSENSFGVPQHDQIKNSYGSQGTITDPEDGSTFTYNVPSGSIGKVEYFLKGKLVAAIYFHYSGTNLIEVRRIV